MSVKSFLKRQEENSTLLQQSGNSLSDKFLSSDDRIFFSQNISAISIVLNDSIAIENNIIDSAETEMASLIKIAAHPFSKHLDAMCQAQMDVVEATVKVQEV